MAPRVSKDQIDEAQSDTEQDDMIAELGRLGDELKAVAKDKEARQEKLKEIEKVLGGMQVKDFADLAESPVVQSFIKMMGFDDLRPGEVRNAGTLAERMKEWTVRDMAQFDQVTFEPRETIPVTFNGLTYQLVDGVEVTVPKPIKDIYDNHRKALVEAKKHEAYMLGYSNTPPDPNWLTEGSATVRAFSQLGPTPDTRKRGVGFIPMGEEAASGES